MTIPCIEIIRPPRLEAWSCLWFVSHKKISRNSCVVFNWIAVAVSTFKKMIGLKPQAQKTHLSQCFSIWDQFIISCCIWFDWSHWKNVLSSTPVGGGGDFCKTDHVQLGSSLICSKNIGTKQPRHEESKCLFFSMSLSRWGRCYPWKQQTLLECNDSCAQAGTHQQRWELHITTSSRDNGSSINSNSTHRERPKCVPNC